MTTQELFEKVLQKLQVTAAGEDSQPEDIALIRSRYTSLYNLLDSEQLVSWDITNDIPDNVEMPLTMMLAAHSGREFGIVGQAYANLIAEGGLALTPMSWAERQLRRLMAKPYIPKPATSEYF
jgi:hypothetical protein